MSKPVVFVDTNCVDNRASATAFLGNRQELEKLAKRAKIILPQVVRDEVARHIQVFLRSQLDAIRRNPHRYHLEIKDNQLEALDLELILSNLEKNETIAHEVLDLSDKSTAFEAIYKHSIEGTPPFEPGGDKGFKDALIAKTIDEYIALEKDEFVFLMTNDGRLSEYFKDNSAVTVIKTYADFDNEYSLDKFDKAMMDRVADFLSIEEGNVGEWLLCEHWLNWDDELVGKFEANGITCYVRIDPQYREPVDYTKDDIDANIKILEDTPSFELAHENVATFLEYAHFLSGAKILQIYEAFRKNDQIYSIGGDDDIRQAAQNLNTILDGFSLHREAENIRIQYGLNEVSAENDDINLSDADEAAELWIEMQSDIARGK